MRSPCTALAAACALLLALTPPSGAQVIGSGHVLGNGTGSPAAPTDTPLLNVLEQSGSGLTRSGNTSTLATTSGTLTNSHCVSIDGSGNLVDAGGTCTVGGGGGTVSSASQYQIPYYTTSGTGNTVGGSGNITTSAGGSSPIFTVTQTTSGTIATALAASSQAIVTDNATADSSGNFFEAIGGQITSTPTTGSPNGIEGRAGVLGLASPSGTFHSNIAATAAFTTSSPDITMTANPGWVTAGMGVFDATTSQVIGTVSTYSGTALVLTANALHASLGSSDIMQFQDAYNGVGLLGVAQADVNLGGTGSTQAASKGGIWGLNTVTNAGGSATDYNNIVGYEMDMNTRQPPWYRAGIVAVDASTSGQGGASYDCAFCVSGATSSIPGWHDGILFGPMNGLQPFNSSSAIIQTSGTATVAEGIDFTSYTFTGPELNLPGFSVSGGGNVGEVNSAWGYLDRQGIDGTPGTNAFNFYWTGSALQGWIDNVNLGNVNFTSDRRVKHNVEPMTGALAGVMRLRPVTFNWRDIGIFRDDHQRHDGLIAQDVQRVFPDAVNGDPDAVNADGTPKPENINPLPMIAVLTESVQELKHQIDRERECNRHFLCRFFGIGA